MLATSIYDDLKLRLGTPEDLHEVMDLAIAAAKENSLVSASHMLLVQTIWPCLNQDRGLVGCIGKKDGPIEGMVVLSVGTLHYSNSPAVEEKVLFVDPKHRNARGGRARKLCDFSKSVAEKLDLPLIIGVFSSISTKQKIELYKREFGEPAGVYFLWNSKTGGCEVTE